MALCKPTRSLGSAFSSTYPVMTKLVATMMPCSTGWGRVGPVASPKGPSRMFGDLDLVSRR